MKISHEYTSISNLDKTTHFVEFDYKKDVYSRDFFTRRGDEVTAQIKDFGTPQQKTIYTTYRVLKALVYYVDCPICGQQIEIKNVIENYLEETK